MPDPDELGEPIKELQLLQRIRELEEANAELQRLTENPEALLRDKLAAMPAIERRRRDDEQAKLEAERDRIKLLEPDVELCHRYAKSLEETIQIRVNVKSNVARIILNEANADVRRAINRLREFEAK